MLVEQSRLRLDYDEFRAAKAAEEEARILDLDSTGVTHSYTLKDYDGELSYKAPIGPMMRFAPPAGKTSDIPPGQAGSPNLPTADTGSGFVPGVPNLQTTAEVAALQLNLTVASSVATVTIQYNTLSDDDIFGDVSAVAMQSVPAMHGALHTITQAASLLSPIPVGFNPTNVDWIVELNRIVASAEVLADMAAPSLSVTVLTGAEAQDTIYVNGVAAEEMPVFEDLLPRFVKDQRAEAEAETDPDAHDMGRDFTQDNDTSRAEDGSQVVAGANTLVNSAAITSVWLDAPVIVAAGDVVRFDGISQINVLVEHDAVSPALLHAAAADKASTVQNVAAIETTSSRSGTETEARADAMPQMPQNWVVARVNGPVTQVNWVQQHNFTTDFDQAVITQSGTTLFLGLGENALGNAFDAFELGFQYDLIIVNGNLIDVNLITQTNILLDSDVVETGAAPAQALSASGAPAVADLPVPAEEEGFAAETEDLASDISATTSHAAAARDVQTVENTAADAGATPLDLGEALDGEVSAADGVSGIDLPADTEEDPVEAYAAEDPGPAPTISTADNLLFNEALIQTIGADIDTVITETFKTAMADLVGGAENVSQDLAADALFDGIGLLRVLYIDGDFTTVNYIDQTNILGDADQVHLLRDDFAAALQAEMVVTTGSNVLANVASIRDSGLDSVVMAQGQVYSDALIHQANLIDNDAATLGSNISDLANEAVAFLVDDMIGGDLAGDIASATASHMADMPGSADIMQSMLT